MPVRRIVAVAFVALLLPGAGLAAQSFSFDEHEPVESAERFGAAFARAEAVPGLPWRWEEPAGSSDRICVEVTPEMKTVRSGEFIIGSVFERLRADAPNKVWWKPLNSSLDMTIEVVSRSLDTPGQSATFELGPATSPFTNDRPPQPIPEEAFFPGGVYFPTPGRWVAVGTSGSNWGCFIFNVPQEPMP